jgi:probable rRNA maturation factor
VLGRVKGHGAPRAALRGLLQDYLKGLGLPRADVALRLVGEGASRGLNRRWRGLDASTDVLSFPGLEGRPPRGFDGHLGDLALCLPYAWARRGRFNPDFGAECAFLILHGLLHLCGRHHDSPAQERAMWRLSRRLHPLGKGRFEALRSLGPEGASV